MGATPPKLLWTGPARIYFNAWTEGPLYWSVDAGEGTEEIKCTTVRLYLSGTAETMVEPESEKQPRAWLAVSRGRVYQDGSAIFIRHAQAGRRSWFVES